MARNDWTERKRIREKVFERDGYTCRYCGDKEGPFHADHAYPWSKGGETSMNNLVTACGRCNSKKGNKVGIYPLPIGHFDEVEAVTKNATRDMKREGSMILLSIIPSSVMASTVVWFPNDLLWIVLKGSVFIWFLASAYCAVYWVWDTLRS